MNRDQQDLIGDAIAGSGEETLTHVLKAARSRRRNRALRNAAAALSVVAAIAFSAALMVTDSRSPSNNATAAETGTQLVSIDDSQLLALLADQGPVIVTEADGTQSLILTRPK